MKIRVAVLPLAVALASSTVAAAAFAGPADVVKGGVELIATGTVMAKSVDSLVVRTDDHGHRITFVVERSTVLPDGLAVGRHVRVVYRADGLAGQTAEQVTLLDRKAPKAGGSS
jgi:hypothetical protein